MKKFLTSCILVVISISLFAQTRKIQDLEKQRKLAINEIEKTTQLLKNTKQTTENLLNRINLLSEQMQARTQVITLLNEEVQAINEEQKRIEQSIIGLQSNLKIEQDAYAKAIQSVAYLKQNKSKLVFVLSGSSISESLRRMKYLRDYSEWRSKQAKNIINKQTELKEKIDILNYTKASKEILLKDRELEKLKLEQEEIAHKKEIEEASKKQHQLQAIINRKQKQANNLNNQIEKLIAAEISLQEQKVREQIKTENKIKKEKTTQRSESKTTEAVKTDYPRETKENSQLSSNFAGNKGRLPMPVTGTYKIVGKFGVQKHQQFTGVETFSNGIDIRARSGSYAKSVFGGEVSRIIAFPGFNNCIIIRHGDYYTFYGNIKDVSVKQGQKVSAGQQIGTVFTDPDSNSALLHFQLWQKTKKLNPEPWLNK